MTARTGGGGGGLAKGGLLVAAARGGDLVAVRALLASHPTPLRPSRGSQMGAIAAAAGGGGRRRAGEGAAAALVPRGAAAVGEEDEAGWAAAAAAALHAAVTAGHVDMTVLLLDWGADPAMPLGEEGPAHEQPGGEGDRSGGGWTALHRACWHGSAGCIGAVVKAGVDAGRLDSSGRTAWELAEARGNTAALEALDGPLAALKVRGHCACSDTSVTCRLRLE